MNLYVEGDSFQNGLYRADSNGVVYKVDTPWKAIHHVTTISKAIPEDITRRDGSDVLGAQDMGADEVSISGAPDTEVLANISSGMIDSKTIRFAHLATIEWAMIGTSKIRYGGRETTTGILFRKGGLGLSGRDRIFQGPDGKEYRWDLEVIAPSLFTSENPPKLIARWHPRRPFQDSKAGKKTPYLEILPDIDTSSEELLNLIILTFICVEKIRRDRQSSRFMSLFDYA